ncbi:MAG: right-handed parallel beta-helix repeat-containing protein [Rikenellaceae bacterium]
MKRLTFTLLTLLVVGFVTDSFCAEKRVKTPKSGTETSPLQVEVSSIKELLPHLRRNYINLKMTPGTYRVTANDVKSGMFIRTTEVIDGQTTFALLLIEGSNNTFDLTGVTIEVESAVANAFDGRRYEFAELHTTGNHNVVKGLKLVDVGSKLDRPIYGWCNVVVDGANNRLDGVEVNSRGSMPYGYGEAFGKGKGYVLKHWKHSAMLVRGDYNHIKDCRIIHHSYGHFLFMQGAVSPLVEGCYIEGEMVSTDRILAEKGTGSEADKIDFKTVWGYTLPRGYTLSTGEDGIRTYTEGNTIVNGEKMRRRTSGDIIVRDCTVKHARGGVTIALGQGTRLIENCTLIGCQHGFMTNSGGKILNCRADVAFGAVFEVGYERNRDITADITVMPYDGEPYGENGQGHVAFIMGSGHNITLRRGEGLSLDRDMYIAIGGDKRSIGSLAEDENCSASNITLVNETGSPIIIDDNAQNVNVTTNGDVKDDGVNSTIIRK